MYWWWLQFGKVLAWFGIVPGSSMWVNVILLQIFLRIPSVLADISIGMLIYLFVKQFVKRERSALVASSIFLFNPVVLFNSAFWGQMDAINNLFALLSVWWLIQKKYISSFMTLAVSLLTKFSLVFLAPFIAFVSWYQSKGKRGYWILACCSILVPIILCVLPISRNPIFWYWNYITHNATGEMTNVTAFAFNMWWVIFHPSLLFASTSDLTKVVNVSLSGSPLTQTMYGPISLGLISTLVALTMITPVFVWVYKRLQMKQGLTQPILIRAYAILCILAYITFPQMHERYLYPAFIPLAILIGFGVPVVWEYILLSICNFINLLIVWHPMPFPTWVFELMRNSTLQWWVALLTTIIGFWTVWKLMRVARPTK